MSEQTIRLTQYSHGAGCGCKISPKVLETILHSEQAKFVDPNLLVGNETRDDAAVYDLGNGTSIISTTDFFMPIVDNPFDFGRIAATNAISDIFAMGGKPIMAIAILGWPINTLPPEIARDVIEGGRFACQQAGIARRWSLYRCAGADLRPGRHRRGAHRTREAQQHGATGLQTVPHQAAGRWRTDDRREKVLAEARAYWSGNGSDVPDEPRRCGIRQYRRREGHDRRDRIWSAGAPL